MKLFDRLKNLQPSAPTQATGATQGKAPYATIASGIKDAFTVFVGGFAPFCILVILTISAGYYFNALRGFRADVQSIIAYGTAAILELVNLALFFVSARAFWQGKRAHFMTALVCGLALTVISVIAQVLYLSNNLDRASLDTGAAILQFVPLFGPLANTGFIIVTRALALHVAEFACCYVIARSAVSHRKVIQAQQEAQEAELAMLEAEQFAAFKRAIHKAQMAQLETVQQMLLTGRTVESEGGPVTPFRPSANAPANIGNGKKGAKV